MERTVERLKASLPAMRTEVARTQEMGDLSENAAYQEAKHHLRRTASRIAGLEERLMSAIPIEAGTNDGQVRIGSNVTVSDGAVERTYQILGSQETDPMKGRISYLSPLGAALMGKREGDEAEANGRAYRVVAVN